MKTIRFGFVAIVLVAAGVFAASTKPACADTFQVLDLGTDNGHTLVGIDDSGRVVIEALNLNPPFTPIYQTWVNGVDVSNSSSPPSLSYDNGTPCVPTVSAPVILDPVSTPPKCNGGHEVYLGLFGSPFPGIFTGPNLSDFLTLPNLSGFVSLDHLDLNAFGDAVLDDGADDEIFEAVDLTTASVPEPGTVFLLGTGVLVLMGPIRRWMVAVG